MFCVPKGKAYGCLANINWEDRSLGHQIIGGVCLIFPPQTYMGMCFLNAKYTIYLNKTSSPWIKITSDF